MSESGEDQPLIYRTEVLSIIGALADMVVELREIRTAWGTMRKRKRTKEERERIRRWAEDHPRVRELRELEARGRAELEARRKGQEAGS
jgi:hypothetical protein